MTLLQMSFSGAILILAILLIRAVLLNRLPKQTFLILWGLALFKLLVPISIPAPCSIYTVLDRSLPVSTEARLPSANLPSEEGRNNDTPFLTSTTESTDTSGSHASETVAPAPAAKALPSAPHKVAALRPSLSLIWCMGIVLSTAFLLLSYLRCRLEFKTALPICHPGARQWLECWLRAHPLRRSIAIRQTDKVNTPLTYGLIRPVILLPKKTDWEDTASLQYVLTHEYVHICRLDAATKLLAAFALCLHWFNPFVWIMYLLFNRDLELACDEKVIKLMGDTCRSGYAHMLIDLEERNSGLLLLNNHFSQNAIEERITAIMKRKKITRCTILFAAGLIVGITAAFATSAVTASAGGSVRRSALPDPAFTGRNSDTPKAAETTAGRILAWQEETTARLCDLILQTGFQAERSREWADILSPYLPFGLTYTYDHELDFFRMYFREKEVRSIFDPQQGIYIAEHLGITADTFDEDARELIAVYENGALAGLRDADAQESQEMIHKRLQDIESKPGIHDNATAKDYRSFLSLMTPDHETMSLTDFNARLLDWGNEHFDSYERIREDFCRNGFQVDLSEEEYRFVSRTMTLSAEENHCQITHLKTGRPQEDPVFCSFEHDRDRRSDDDMLWCGFDYSFSYHIADMDQVTVGERDHLVGHVIDDIHTFWAGSRLEDLLTLTREDVLAILEKIAARYSNETITFTILEDQFYFEHADNRSPKGTP